MSVKNKTFYKYWNLLAFYLFLYDIIAVNFSYFFALFLRFDFIYSNIPQEYFHSYLKFTPVYSIFCILVFHHFSLYKSLWRFASFNELNAIIVSSVITTLFQIVGITVFLRQMPFSYYIFGATTQFCLISGMRFSYRFIAFKTLQRERKTKLKRNAMIIGAGKSGLIIIKELNDSPKADVIPRCVIDDDSTKWNRLIEGVPIVGGRDEICRNVKKYKIDQILFAIPSASPKTRKEILEICKESGCKLQTLPAIFQLASGEVSLEKIRPVIVEDLLGRDPVNIDMNLIFQTINGRTILVTGGGGSIGSELCRQIAPHNPKMLIIFDSYENGAYDVQQELKANCPNLNLVVLIGSVRDRKRIDAIFEQYRPDVVYHAAAHKHVPLMEDSPNEAIKNNVFGTYETARAALKYGTERFVMISTDKAVNPTNIMGASKRLCEMIIQSMNTISQDEGGDLSPYLGKESEKTAWKNLDAANRAKRSSFCAVRFGNVLGSNGSCIPLFKRQISYGGPVTVTHPDIVRYFMTIPEAVSLVLEAGVAAKGGEIFVLDMGDPVKIDALARNLIKLSGFQPDEEIKIVYTGLRPGEKLYEEKLMSEEGLEKTCNNLIFIGKPIRFNKATFFKQLEKLAEASSQNSDEIVKLTAEIVPTFHPAESACGKN